MELTVGIQGRMTCNETHEFSPFAGARPAPFSHRMKQAIAYERRVAVLFGLKAFSTVQTYGFFSDLTGEGKVKPSQNEKIAFARNSGQPSKADWQCF